MKKLNIGSGDRELKGFTNLDGKFGDDITKLDYKDDSVDVIYASHVLEYFDREEVKGVLKEWRRVLKPEGKIYLSVPDFRVMAELYIKNNIPLFKFLGPMYGKMEMNGKTIYHKTIYDYASLGELLVSIGFRRIETWNFISFCVDQDLLNYDDHGKAVIDDRFISLNLEAKK